MSEPIKLCKDCSFFIESSKHCGRSTQAPDYVYGSPRLTIAAQTEREMSVIGCGPAAKFFMPIIPAGYAEPMIRKDQRERHEGRADDFGVSACGRSDRAGS